MFWRWKSRTTGVGRPKIEAKIRSLIRRMSRKNTNWGVPRIQSELALLGHTVSEATVRKYRIRHRKPPSQTWRTFLDNHLTDIVAIDFFTVPTATFRILFAFVVLRHDRRKVVHFNVTANPTAEWTAQQIVEAFPEEQAPRFLIRDTSYGLCRSLAWLGYVELCFYLWSYLFTIRIYETNCKVLFTYFNDAGAKLNHKVKIWMYYRNLASIDGVKADS